MTACYFDLCVPHTHTVSFLPLPPPAAPFPLLPIPLRPLLPLSLPLTISLNQVETLEQELTTVRAELTQRCAEVELMKNEGEREQRQLQHVTAQLEQVGFTNHWQSEVQ